jgi:hypothetical protein
MSSKPKERWRGHSLHKKPGIRAVCRASSIEPLENRLYLTTTAYTWENVNIGGGGFVDGVFYDPNNQNTIYARTDIGGLYKTTNDGATWNELLDWVGSNSTGAFGFGTNTQELGVQSFAIDPENSNNIYADVIPLAQIDRLIQASAGVRVEIADFDDLVHRWNRMIGRDGDVANADPPGTIQQFQLHAAPAAVGAGDDCRGRGRELQL